MEDLVFLLITPFNMEFPYEGIQSMSTQTRGGRVRIGLKLLYPEEKFGNLFVDRIRLS